MQFMKKKMMISDFFTEIIEKRTISDMEEQINSHLISFVVFVYEIPLVLENKNKMAVS